MSSLFKYRPEIDGLRTVAVLAVIIFHLDSKWLQGGFLGVDVFFVISGFLITSIIYSKTREGSFSIIEFWKRRIKRLYPALMAMVGVVLLVSAFVLVRPERGQLWYQALGAMFSYENIVLWQTTWGYWAPASENISLLHTWSLSLEEQFYVCFPITLVLINWLARGKEKLIICGLLVASFCLCVYATADYRSPTFYLLPARMWELLIGSVLAIQDITKKPNRDYRLSWLIQIVGITMIITSFFLIKNDESFPSFYPLLPCVGTLLLLMYGGSKGIVQSILSAKPVVYLGKISYSLYLWHWPVIVFMRYTNPSFSILTALVLTFLLASASYHFVECPFRYGVKRTRLLLATGTIALASCFLPILLLDSSPLLKDLGDIDSKASLSRGMEFEATKQLRAGEPGMVALKGTGGADIIVVGSSHSRVLCSPIVDYAKEKQLSLSSLATSGFGISWMKSDKKYPDAVEINQKKIQIIKDMKPTIVILAGQWNEEIKLEGFEKTLIHSLSQMSSHAKHVIVVGQVPMVVLPRGYEWAMRKLLIAQCLQGSEPELVASEDVLVSNDRVKQIVSEIKADNLVFVNPYDLFIESKGTVKVIQNGRFLYSDFNHVNDRGSSLIFETLLKKPIAEIFKAAPLQSNGAEKAIP